MQLSEKESKLISSGKIKAVIRFEKTEDRIGDPLFTVNNKVYYLQEKKRWSLHRVGTQRGRIDFKADTLDSFKSIMTFLYGDYRSTKDKIVYLIIFKEDKKQMVFEV